MGQVESWQMSKEFQRGPERWSGQRQAQPDQSRLWWEKLTPDKGPDGRTGAKVLPVLSEVTSHTLDVRSVPPWSGASFSPSSIEQTGLWWIKWVWPMMEVTSRPCTPASLLPPWNTSSEYLSARHQKIHGGHPWQLELPWHHARSRASKLSREPFKMSSLFSSSCLVSYLFIMVWLFWNLKGIIKGKRILKVMWLRASTLDCGSLCLWLTSPRRWPDISGLRPQWATLAFGVGVLLDEPRPLAGRFLWLCYVLSSLERSASSSSLQSDFLVRLIRLWTLLCSTVPCECSLQHQHLPLNADEGIWRRS